MKKALVMIVASLMVLSLLAVGCGGNGGSTSGSAAPPSQTTSTPAGGSSTAGGSEESRLLQGEWTIGWANSFAAAYGAAADNYIQAQSKRYPNVTLHMTNAQAEATKQVADIEDLILKGCDAIIILPIDASTLYNVKKQADDAGILVFSVVRNQEQQVGYELGPDMTNVGKNMAEHFLAKIPDGPINYCWLLGETGNVNNIESYEGFKATMAASGREINELDAKNHASSRAESKPIVEDWITAYGDEINVIACGNDESAMGALAALKEAGMENDVLVNGVNATIEFMDEMKTNPAASLSFVGSTGCFPAFEMALDILNGNGDLYQQKYSIPVVPISRDEAQEYLDMDLSGLYMLGELQPDVNPIFKTIKGTYPEIDALIELIPPLP